MRAIGVVAEALFVKHDPRFPVYWLIGLGPWWLENLSGVENSYGAVWGATTGFGLAAHLGRLEPFAEARGEAILTGFGVGKGSFWTAVRFAVGARWRPGRDGW